jgi:hypothetical protein
MSAFEQSGHEQLRFAAVQLQPRATMPHRKIFAVGDRASKTSKAVRPSTRHLRTRNSVVN